MFIFYKTLDELIACSVYAKKITKNYERVFFNCVRGNFFYGGQMNQGVLIFPDANSIVGNDDGVLPRLFRMLSEIADRDVEMHIVDTKTVFKGSDFHDKEKVFELIKQVDFNAENES